jgi:hypothetical protein
VETDFNCVTPVDFPAFKSVVSAAVNGIPLLDDVPPASVLGSYDGTGSGDSA